MPGATGEALLQSVHSWNHHRKRLLTFCCGRVAYGSNSKALANCLIMAITVSITQPKRASPPSPQQHAGLPIDASNPEKEKAILGRVSVQSTELRDQRHDSASLTECPEDLIDPLKDLKFDPSSLRNPACFSCSSKRQLMPAKSATESLTRTAMSLGELPPAATVRWRWTQQNMAARPR